MCLSTVRIKDKGFIPEAVIVIVMITALNQATRLKDKSPGRVSTDAEEALLWLDDATSNAPHLVTLQGGYEKFETWAEVEKFALPKPLFSEEDVEDYDEDLEDGADDMDGKLPSSAEKSDKHLSMSSAESDVTRSATPDSLHSVPSSMSPVSLPESPVASNSKSHIQKPVTNGITHSSMPRKSTQNKSSDSGVPQPLRSLYNYILWRVQQEIDPAAALESFIFLCDDPLKAKLAQRFGIRVKSLADIRFVVAREEREFRNRQVVQRKENENIASANTGRGSRPSTRGSPAVPTPTPTTPAPAPEEKDISDDDEEIVFKRPPKAPAAMIAAQQQQTSRPKSKVLDPNHFTRGSGGRGNARGGTTRGGAGGRGGARGGAPATNVAPARGDLTPATNNTGPIDPDSFSRPPPAGGRFRGGGGRKLFVPT